MEQAACQKQSRNGFTLVEMLVALMLIGLVALTLIRFQTFQIGGSGRLALTAAARLEADNRVVDFMAARDIPAAPMQGVSHNLGREWHWRMTPGPSPDPLILPNATTLAITISAEPDGPVLASRQIVRSRP